MGFGHVAIPISTNQTPGTVTRNSTKPLGLELQFDVVDCLEAYFGLGNKTIALAAMSENSLGRRSIVVTESIVCIVISKEIPEVDLATL